MVYHPRLKRFMCRLVCFVSGVALVILFAKQSLGIGPSAQKYLEDTEDHVHETEGVCVDDDCGRKEGKVTLAAAACGDRLEEVFVMVKSAVLLTNLPRLDIIIFTDEELVESFRERVDSWPEAVTSRTNVR